MRKSPSVIPAFKKTLWWHLRFGGTTRFVGKWLVVKQCEVKKMSCDAIELVMRVVAELVF